MVAPLALVVLVAIAFELLQGAVDARRLAVLGHDPVNRRRVPDEDIPAKQATWMSESSE